MSQNKKEIPVISDEIRNLNGKSTKNLQSKIEKMIEVLKTPTNEKITSKKVNDK